MAGANVGSRETILGRIRAAVKNKAPKSPASPARPMFPPIHDPLERFQSECQGNFMECILTDDKIGTTAALRQILESLPSGELFVQDAPQLRSVVSNCVDGRPIRWSSEGAPAETSQATVSLCEALVAQTGSVLVASGSCGGRGISIVAPCHIVVARAEQLVPDLETALARAGDIAFHNSFVGLITGSSRTADIEKLLVIGAHGPRRLAVILQRQ